MRMSLLPCHHRPQVVRDQFRTLWHTNCSRHSRSIHSSAATTAAAAVDGPKPLFSIEASVGAANPLDIQLISTGAFRAEVHPDLPVATTWHGFYRQLASRLQAGVTKEARRAAAAAQALHNAAVVEQIGLSGQLIASTGAKPVLHVATVGAQLNKISYISDTMCAAAGVTPTGEPKPGSDHRPHADALLLVSGSHPFRQVPLLRRVLPSSVTMLTHATKLKQQGILPQQVSLWAVANPVTERDASYAERKVAAGAEVILTQPPLDWDAFERWMDDARRRGLHTAARLLVGFPLLSSAGNVAFWAALCQAGDNQQVQQLQQQFAAAEQKLMLDGRNSDDNSQPMLRGMSPLAEKWNYELLARLQATSGVSGLHVMPITANSKRLALRFAQEGAFSAAAWPLAAIPATRTSV